MSIGAGSEENENQVFSPKNYLLRSVKLLRQGLGGQDIGAKAISLVNKVLSIDVIESIYNSGIQVDLQIKDDIQLFSNLRLNGTEKIALIISRGIDTPDETFKFLLSVINIDTFSDVNEGMKSYKLRCAYDYTIVNQSKTISDDFDDISKKIGAIAKNDLEIPEKLLDISKSSQSAQGIIPRMKPLAAINWLTRNIADGGTPYYFYQTSSGIVHLKSYKEMLNDIHEKDEVYSNNPNITRYDKEDAMKDTTQSAFKDEKFTINKIVSNLNISPFKGVADGIYRSNKFSYDIFKKEYKASEKFKASDLSNSLNKFASIPKEYFNNKGDTGKNYYINLNSGAFDNEVVNYNTIVNDTIQEKESYHNRLETITQEFLIPGDFTIEAGKVIRVLLVDNAFEEKIHEDDTPDPMDRQNSGLYLITSIVHTFREQEFMSRLVCKKDTHIDDQSVPKEYFASTDPERTIDLIGDKNG